MLIPNADGKYKTKDESILVIVTRKEICIDVQQPSDGFTVIDGTPQNRESQSTKSADTAERLKRMKKNMDAITEFLGF